MAEALKIRGVPYRSIEELEAATRKLCADLVLLDSESEEHDELARQVADMLAHLPEETARDIYTAFVVTPNEDEVSAEAEVLPDIEVDERRGTIVIDGNEHAICPMCLGVGWLTEEPPQDPTSERCPDCEGVGKVYTGSRVPGQATRSCPTCAGNGWKLRDGVTPPPPGESGAAEFPEWPGAIWDNNTLRWNPPPGEELPWDGATWNDMRGTWVPAQ